MDRRAECLRGYERVDGVIVSTGRDDEVYALAKESLCIAQDAEGTRVLADVGIEIATMML